MRAAKSRPLKAGAVRTRALAVEILCQSERPGAHSNALLQRARSKLSLHYPLLQRMVKGTLQWRDRIDSIWLRHAKQATSSLGAQERNLIRIAVYQLLFLEHVERELILRETETLVQQFNPEGARKAVSLLRSLDPSEASAEVSNAEKNLSSDDIARNFSHPVWLVRRWIEQWGKEETIKLCAANNRPWPVCVRVNSLKAKPQQVAKSLQAQGVHVSRGKFVKGCFHLQKIPRDVDLESLEAFRYGLMQVQDESSALMGLLLDPQPGESVLDLCAAPGGKAVHLAALMRNEGRILAVDIHDSKLSLVKDNCKRPGAKIVRLKCADASTLALQSPADKILLDAPCSGLGVLGRKADIRWAKDARTIEELAQLQGRLLDNSAKLLRPGGRVLYSTCTIDPLENEGVVNAFLTRHPNFKVIVPTERCPRELLTKEGFVRTWPHRHGMAGAFAALLEKQA